MNIISAVKNTNRVNPQFNGYLVYSRQDGLSRIFNEMNDISDIWHKHIQSEAPVMIQIGYDEWKTANDIAIERELETIVELNNFRELDKMFTKVVNSFIGESRGKKAAKKIMEKVKQEEENPGFLSEKFPFIKIGQKVNSLKLDDFRKLAEYFVKQDIKVNFDYLE